MASQSADLELREWLTGAGFGKQYEALKECGVGCLDDLRILKTEDEIKELAGPSGINLGVVFRRKFILAVLSLNDGGDAGSTPANVRSTPSTPQAGQATLSPTDASPSLGGGGPVNESAMDSDSSTKRRSIQMSGTEDQALQRLRGTIRSHTQSLKLMKDNVPLLAKQARDARAFITELFDQTMKELVKRKKFLEDNINLAESETTNNLNKKIADLGGSARTLLAAKKNVEKELAKEVTEDEKRQRATFVVQTITDALKAAPKEESSMYHLIVDQQGVDLQNIISNFGQVTVTRKKESSQDPPAQ